MDFSFNRPKQPVKLADLMPSRMRRTPKPRFKSKAQVADNVRQILGGFMAKS